MVVLVTHSMKSTFVVYYNACVILSDDTQKHVMLSDAPYQQSKNIIGVTYN